MILAAILGGAAAYFSFDRPLRETLTRSANSPSLDNPTFSSKVITAGNRDASWSLRRLREEARVLNPRAQAVLEEMNKVWETARLGKALSADSWRIRDELLDQFVEEGATADDLLEWGLTVIESGGTLDGIIESVFLKAAQLDAGAAVNWLLRNDKVDGFERTRVGQNWNYYFRRASEQWIQIEPRVAIGFLENNMDRVEARDVRYIIDDWAGEDIAASVAWVERQRRDGNPLMSPTWFGAVAGNWARQDPAAAINWVETLAGRERSWGLTSIAYRTPDELLGELTSWVSSQSPQDESFDPSREIIAGRLVESNPREAIDLARGISNRAKSEALVMRAARALVQSEPEFVRNWLPTSGLSEDVQEAIISTNE
jgi:hypothetical protein